MADIAQAISLFSTIDLTRFTRQYFHFMPPALTLPPNPAPEVYQYLNYVSAVLRLRSSKKILPDRIWCNGQHCRLSRGSSGFDSPYPKVFFFSSDLQGMRGIRGRVRPPRILLRMCWSCADRPMRHGKVVAEKAAPHQTAGGITEGSCIHSFRKDKCYPDKECAQIPIITA